MCHVFVGFMLMISLHERKEAHSDGSDELVEQLLLDALECCTRFGHDCLCQIWSLGRGVSIKLLSIYNQKHCTLACKVSIVEKEL